MALGVCVMFLGSPPLAGQGEPSQGVLAALTFLVAHALYKAALFLVAGTIEKATGTRDLTWLEGLRRPMPVTFDSTQVLSGIEMWSSTCWIAKCGFTSWRRALQCGPRRSEAAGHGQVGGGGASSGESDLKEAAPRWSPRKPAPVPTADCVWNAASPRRRGETGRYKTHPCPGSRPAWGSRSRPRHPTPPVSQCWHPPSFMASFPVWHPATEAG